MSITTARKDLASALEGAGYTVFAQPMENMPVPCVVLVPGQPYVEFPVVNINRLTMNFKATLMVAMIDNQASILNLETLMSKFLDVLPAGVQIGQFSQPGLVQNGPVDCLSTEVTLTIQTTKE
jgi:Asp-tRNA(Asn)/Glu-tRNA(Gln) amidotransferase B subunit